MREGQEELQQLASGARHRVSDRIGDIWWWFLIRGLLAVGLSFFAFFWPGKTVGILVNLLGVYFLFDGVMGAIAAVRAGGRSGFPAFAVVSLVVGAILLFWTGVSIKLFLILVGAWLMLQGVSLFLSNRSRETDQEARQLFGIASAVMAVTGLILIVWPGTGVVAISWLISAVALGLGCVLIFLATRLRRLARRIDSPA